MPNTDQGPGGGTAAILNSSDDLVSLTKQLARFCEQAREKADNPPDLDINSMSPTALNTWIARETRSILEDVITDDFWVRFSLRKPENHSHEVCPWNMPDDYAALLLVTWSRFNKASFEAITQCLESGAEYWSTAKTRTAFDWINAFVYCVKVHIEVHASRLRRSKLTENHPIPEDGQATDSLAIEDQFSKEIVKAKSLVGAVAKSSDLFRIMTNQSPIKLVESFLTHVKNADGYLDNATLHPSAIDWLKSFFLPILGKIANQHPLKDFIAQMTMNRKDTSAIDEHAEKFAEKLGVSKPSDGSHSSTGKARLAVFAMHLAQFESLERLRNAHRLTKKEDRAVHQALTDILMRWALAYDKEFKFNSELLSSMLKFLADSDEPIIMQTQWVREVLRNDLLVDHVVLEHQGMVKLLARGLTLPVPAPSLPAPSLPAHSQPRVLASLDNNTSIRTGGKRAQVGTVKNPHSSGKEKGNGNQVSGNTGDPNQHHRKVHFHEESIAPSTVGGNKAKRNTAKSRHTRRKKGIDETGGNKEKNKRAAEGNKVEKHNTKKKRTVNRKKVEKHHREGVGTDESSLRSIDKVEKVKRNTAQSQHSSRNDKNHAKGVGTDESRLRSIDKDEKVKRTKKLRFDSSMDPPSQILTPTTRKTVEKEVEKRSSPSANVPSPQQMAALRRIAEKSREERGNHEASRNTQKKKRAEWEVDELNSPRRSPRILKQEKKLRRT